MIGSHEVIKLGSTDCEVIGTILGDVYVITFGIGVGTEMGSLDGSLDCSNDGKHEGFLLGDLLESIDGKVLVSYEGIKLGSTGGKIIDTIFEDVYGITFGIDAETKL